MTDLINEAVIHGESIEDHKDEFQEISAEITQLNSQIETIKETAKSANATNDRIAEISKIVDSLEGTIFDKIRSSMVVKKYFLSNKEVEG